VSAVRLCSIRLKTLSSPLVGGPPVAVGPPAIVGPASGRGCHRVLMKFVELTGPTSVHKRYIKVSTLIHIKMIYIKTIKN
jgi:hypothetical protein